MHILYMLGALILSAAQSSDTNTKAAAPYTWQQEPTSFLNVKLARPLGESLPECPTVLIYGAQRYAGYNTPNPCFEKINGELFKIDNIPNFFDVYAEEVGNAVASVSAKFRADTAASVAAALVEKFGPPLSKEETTVKTKAGVEYGKSSYGWQGKDVTLLFESIASQVDEGSVTAVTHAYVLRSQSKEAAQKDKLKATF